MEYTIYRGSKKLFAKDNLKEAQDYAKYWAKKDKLIYSVVSSDGQEFVYEPPVKVLGWYIWQLGKKFKTLKATKEYISSMSKHQELDIYKIVAKDELNDTYIKYKTVQAL